MIRWYRQLSYFKKWLVATFTGALLSFIAIQFFPVGRFASSLERDPNPPITTTIKWDTTEAETIARKACYDCHSNETEWPWYSHIAPVSWLITRDVNNGRAALNFSAYDPSTIHVEDLRDHVYEDMPPATYHPLHPEARLTDEEREILIAAIIKTLPDANNMDGMDMSDTVEETEAGEPD